MKSIDLSKDQPAVLDLIRLAEKEPVLLLAPDGHPFLLGEADNFEAEVEALSNSRRFQEFLDRRIREDRRIPIEEIEKEIAGKLKKE